MNDQNSLEIVPPVAFTAGETKEWAFSGSYFELIDCPDPVDVDLTDRNGSLRTRMRGAEASFYSKSVEFGRIVITSATAQTIKFAYGSGEAGTRRSTGSVTVSGAIALDAATLLALEFVQVRPEAPTGNYKNNAAIVANTAEVVFTAAANTNGAILLDAGANVYGGATAPIAGFVAKATPPATPLDGDPVFVVGISITQSGTGNVSGGNLSQPQNIPAGVGLYFISDQASAGAGGGSWRHARYKLL